MVRKTEHFPVYTDTGKRGRQMGVSVRDYKKTKNILMGIPARKSVKRVQKNLSSFYYFLVKSDNVNREHRSKLINYAVTKLQQIVLNFLCKSLDKRRKIVYN